MAVIVFAPFIVTLQMRLPVPPMLSQPVQPEKLREPPVAGAVKTIRVPLAAVFV